VQVADSVGVTETDLTGLRKSKKKGSNEHGLTSPMQRAPLTARAPQGIGSRSTTQSKHRSLNALLGTTRGPLGKAALPSRSPFDERHAGVENHEWEHHRSPKRQRTDSRGAWTVSRTTRSAKPLAPKAPPLWARTVDSVIKRCEGDPCQQGQQRLGTKEIIDLCSNDPEPERFLPGFSSDALAPLSSPKEQQPIVVNEPDRSRSPTVNSTRRAIGKSTQHMVPHEILDHDHVTAGNRKPYRQTPAEFPAAIASGDTAQAQAKAPLSVGLRRDSNSASDDQGTASMQPPTSKPNRALRAVASAPKKKKTLVCQDQVSRKPCRTLSANTESAIDALLVVTSQEQAPAKKRRKIRRGQSLERSIPTNETEGSTKRYLQHTEKAGQVVEVNDNDHEERSGYDRPKTPLEQDTTSLAKLDEMLMPVERPPFPKPLASIAPPSEPRQLRRAISESGKPRTERPKRTPGAPVRITPSPAKKAAVVVKASLPEATIDTAADARKARTSLPPRSRAKKPLQRAASLNIASNGTSTVILSEPFQTPKAPEEAKPAPPPKEPEPWSREAFDLFEWRPPGWNEEGWCVTAEC
jgi:hypothetical protein